MKKLMNLLRGMVRLKVCGPFPERLLNLCAQRGISFWGLEWEDAHTLWLTTRRGSVGRLRELGEGIDCTITTGERWGLPFFLGRFRRRYGFLAGLAVSMAAVLVLSGMVLTVEVTGNERVPTAQILGELRRLGLSPGVYGPTLELKQIGQEALLSLEELSWMTINLHGTRAEVIVREVKKPPEMVDESGCWDVVAQADGIVLQVEPLNGEPLVKEGDVVAAGDILIAGNVSMKPPLYSDRPVRYFQTHSHGRVWARTWRTLKGKIPLECTIKGYTGEEKRSFALNFFGRTMEFFGNSSISDPFYDKITTVYPLTLPGGETLPVSWSVQRERAYQPQTIQVDRDAAQDLLEGELRKRLDILLEGDGQVLTEEYSAVVEEGWLTVTLSAQCREEIGQEVPAREILEEHGAAAP